jgi:hypothetical protein
MRYPVELHSGTQKRYRLVLVGVILIPHGYPSENRVSSEHSLSIFVTLFSAGPLSVCLIGEHKRLSRLVKHQPVTCVYREWNT